jgi:hypothetical protein
MPSNLPVDEGRVEGANEKKKAETASKATHTNSQELENTDKRFAKEITR